MSSRMIDGKARANNLDETTSTAEAGLWISFFPGNFDKVE